VVNYTKTTHDYNIINCNKIKGFKMNKKVKLAGMLLGTVISTSAMADMKEGAKCGAGKCGGEMKKEMKSSKCGAGKCGGEMQKEMKQKKSSKCGSGKCGSEMNKDMNNEMKKESKSAKCGSGKCGSN
jgi:uncharacterized low-complexity protein